MEVCKLFMCSGQHASPLMDKNNSDSKQHRKPTDESLHIHCVFFPQLYELIAYKL